MSQPPLLSSPQCVCEFPSRLYCFQYFIILFCAQSVQDIFNMQSQIHISNASILLMSLFCRVYVSLPYNAILHTNALTMRFFQLEAGGSTHEIFFLVKSFLCKCNVTSYFTFTSAVLGYHTSKVAELCD